MSDEPTCDLCGTPARGPAAEPGHDPVDPGHDPGVPLTWTTAFEHGRRKVFCVFCSREHLRSIEGKLDSAWW
jgi:hypothetical protein